MRKLLAIVLTLVMALSFTACGTSSTASADTQTTDNTAAEAADTTETTETADEAAEAADTTETAKEADAEGSYRTLDEIQASGKIVIGVFSDKMPFGYVDENGDYQGYDVYFAERIAQDLGVDVEYVATDPASRVEFVATGKVDLILANFTVTDERAEQVDFALPYMKVALGVVSPDSDVITDVSQLADKTLIVVKGTTAETYFEANYPEVELLKFDAYVDAYNALLDGRGDAFSTDNTEVLAWALSNPGYTVGIDSLGDIDTIAPAVQKGNTTLLDWINDEIVALADEDFFHADYAATLASVYGDAADPDALVVEGGVVD
jgi:polar amino acid transport system substrate-binding protein